MEIKFRAWDVKEKKMISHEELNEYDKAGVFCLMDIIKSDNKEGLIVTQYTGQKDKNGKEIYVGDRVIDKHGQTWEVIINHDNSCMCLQNEEVGYNAYFDDEIKAGALRVIGHIYETQN